MICIINLKKKPESLFFKAEWDINERGLNAEEVMNLSIKTAHSHCMVIIFAYRSIVAFFLQDHAFLNDLNSFEN